MPEYTEHTFKLNAVTADVQQKLRGVTESLLGIERVIQSINRQSSVFASNLGAGAQSAVSALNAATKAAGRAAGQQDAHVKQFAANQKSQLAEEARADRMRGTMAREKIRANEEVGRSYVAQEKSRGEKIKAARTQVEKELRRSLERIDPLSGAPSSQHRRIYSEQLSAYESYQRKLNNIKERMTPSVGQRRAIITEIGDTRHQMNLLRESLGGIPQPRKGIAGFYDSMMGENHRGLVSRGMQGLPITAAGMAGFAKNLGTVTGWTLAVGTLYKAIELTTYSLQRMQDVGLQTARLTQVFRGSAAGARGLSDDVLKLAAVEGRATDEALDAAIAWSRLGLSRAQAAEATKISLMGANVAEISSADAAKNMAAIMAGYNQQVNQLGGSLGILNQLSNTYRVTNKELFEGLSRVSGLAQQAGISYAKLSGIIAASVQKTGQTGANMSNAMKTVLVRLNRDDVKEFFSKRFKVDIGGTEEGLQKVIELYRSANDQQRDDILLKVGAATQANRLRAIIGAYADGMVGAADSLKHLNSAEEENLKVTNTVAAARLRLIATWDRFVVNSSEKTGFGSWIKDQLNSISSIIAGLSPKVSDSKQSRQVFNPDQATKAGAFNQMAKMATFGLDQFIEPLMHLAIPGTKRYSDLRESYKAGQDAIAGVSEYGPPSGALTNRNRAIAFAESENIKAATLKSFLKGGFRPEEKQKATESLRPFLSGEQYARLQKGDDSGVRAALVEAKAKAEHAKETAEAQHKLAVAEKERQILSARNQFAHSGLEQDKVAVEELAKELDDINGKWREFNKETEEAGELTLVKLTKQMAVFKGITEDLNQSFSGMGLSKYRSEIFSLQAQLAIGNRMLETPGLEKDAKTQIETQQREQGARLDYLRGGVGAAFNRREITQRYEGARIETMGTGASEGEKLLDRRAKIAAELAKFVEQEPKDQIELARAQALTGQLALVEFQIYERSLKNKQEQLQTQKEINKEFQKSLIGAGPGELLRKMATAQLASRGMNAGSFFALSPEAQKDVYQMRGGEKMMDLKTEAEALSGKAQGLPGMLAMDETLGNLGEKFGVQAAQFIGPDLGSAFGKSAAAAMTGTGTMPTPQAKAGGGLITGGSGTKDDVPALLVGGEGVLNRRAMSMVGPEWLAAVNSGKPIQKFSTGGVAQKILASRGVPQDVADFIARTVGQKLASETGEEFRARLFSAVEKNGFKIPKEAAMPYGNEGMVRQGAASMGHSPIETEQAVKDARMANEEAMRKLNENNQRILKQKTDEMAKMAKAKAPRPAYQAPAEGWPSGTSSWTQPAGIKMKTGSAGSSGASGYTAPNYSGASIPEGWPEPPPTPPPSGLKMAPETPLPPSDIPFPRIPRDKNSGWPFINSWKLSPAKFGLLTEAADVGGSLAGGGFGALKDRALELATGREKFRRKYDSSGLKPLSPEWWENENAANMEAARVGQTGSGMTVGLMSLFMGNKAKEQLAQRNYGMRGMVRIPQQAAPDEYPESPRVPEPERAKDYKSTRAHWQEAVKSYQADKRRGLFEKDKAWEKLLGGDVKSAYDDMYSSPEAQAGRKLKEKENAVRDKQNAIRGIRTGQWQPGGAITSGESQSNAAMATLGNTITTQVNGAFGVLVGRITAAQTSLGTLVTAMDEAAKRMGGMGIENTAPKARSTAQG